MSVEVTYRVSGSFYRGLGYGLVLVAPFWAAVTALTWWLT